MAGLFPYAFFSQVKNDINFNGGLNSTSGPLSLKDTEASDLQNIDFNKFGSILKRNGYLNLDSLPIWSTNTLLTDGAFSLWSNSSTLTDWTTGSGTLAQESTIVYSGSTYSAKLTYSTGTEAYLEQDIANYASYANNTIALGCWVWCATPNIAFIKFDDGVNSAHSSSYHPGDSQWHYLTVTGTMASSPAIFRVRLNINSTYGTAYFDAATAYVIPTNQNSDGLMWYEYVSGGAYASQLLNASNGHMYAMSALNGTYTDITGSATITAGNFFSYTNWANNCFMTNGEDAPLYYTGTGNVATIPTLLPNSYTFTVYGISASPAVGDTYTNNAITYTISYVNTSGTAGSIAGTLIATGSGAPTTYGALTRTAGSGDGTINFSLEVFNANISSAKYVTQWNNYLFFANVDVAGQVLPTRIYWCNVRDWTTVSAVNWIEISMQDGQPITGMYPLADRLVIFKERSIYNLFFTGDATLPFVYLVSNSPTVGCVAPYSVQEIENGLVFLSYDGFYYYDSNNSYKMSLQIQNTINGLNLEQIQNARSLKQRQKNRYMCAVPSGASSTNDTVIVWDWVLNAFSKYAGMYPSAMRTCYVSGYQEQLYFADYGGYTYQMDTGVNDYPLGVQTAINAYYWTNWKTWGDAMLQKASPNVVIYYESNNAVLTFGYSYDFDGGIDYQNLFSTATPGAIWDSSYWDSSSSVWAGSGGLYKRQDLNGRGRVVRFYFANSNLSEQMQIDGLASFVNVETNV